MLYQTVAEHWPGSRERAEDAGGLPRFVVREVEKYLDCGILERGCLHLACKECGYSQLVAFSCKRRGSCPSCIGRRMADTAVPTTCSPASSPPGAARPVIAGDG